MAEHMTAEQLLTCPFCGGAPRVKPQDPSVDGDAWTAIGCPECEFEFRAFDDDRNTHFTMAAEKWNRRAARLSGMAADTWQPIETAPKDRRIELWIPGSSSLNPGKPTHGEWESQRLHARPRPFWRYDLFYRESDMRDKQPTHWREPSPEPPHD